MRWREREREREMRERGDNVKGIQKEREGSDRFNQ